MAVTVRYQPTDGRPTCLASQVAANGATEAPAIPAAPEVSTTDLSLEAFDQFLAECDPGDQPGYARWRAWETAGRPDWSEVKVK